MCMGLGMADGSRTYPSGRIRPENADRCLISALVCVATSRIDTPDQDLALHLIERCLPLASRSSRIEGFRDVAQGVLAAAPHRRKPGRGATDWCVAQLDLSRALAADAIRIARLAVED